MKDSKKAAIFFDTEYRKAMDPLINYRNNEWGKLMSKANEMIKERANIIIENISK